MPTCVAIYKCTLYTMHVRLFMDSWRRSGQRVLELKLQGYSYQRKGGKFIREVQFDILLLQTGLVVVLRLNVLRFFLQATIALEVIAHK